MNLIDLKNSNRIIFECVAGSHLYNLNVKSSDEDTRGVYLNPSTEYLGLIEPEPQIDDTKHDVVYYSLKRFFDLMKKSNPNIIELVFAPNHPVEFGFQHGKKSIRTEAFSLAKKPMKHIMLMLRLRLARREDVIKEFITLNLKNDLKKKTFVGLS